MAKNDLIQLLKTGARSTASLRREAAKYRADVRAEVKRESSAGKSQTAKPATKKASPIEALQKAASLSVMVKAKVSGGMDKKASLKCIIKSEGIDNALTAILRHVEG